VHLLDVVVQVARRTAGVLADGTDPRLGGAVSCDMIRQGLALVCFVFTVRTVELEDASVSILTVLHLVETHVTMAAFITPESIEYLMDW